MNILKILLLIHGLLNNGHGSELNHLARLIMTDLDSVAGFVTSAGGCLDARGLTHYQESFCKNNNNDLLSFDSLELDYATEVEKHLEDFERRLNESPLRDKNLESIKKFLDNAYEACMKEEEKEKSLENDIALIGTDNATYYRGTSKNRVVYRAASAAIPTNPDAFDDLLDQLLSYKKNNNDKDFHQKIDSLIQNKIELRKRMFFDSSDFAMLLLKEVDNIFKIWDNDAFKEDFYIRTGIRYEDHGKIVNDFAQMKLEFEKATAVYYSKSQNQSEKVTLVSRPNEPPVYRVEPNDPHEFWSFLKKELNYSDEAFKKMQDLFAETPANQIKRERVIEELTTKFENEINELRKIESEIMINVPPESIVVNKVAVSVNDKNVNVAAKDESDIMELPTITVTPDDSPKAFCEENKMQWMRDIAEDEYLVNFYGEKSNKNFVLESFRKTQDIMGRTIQNLNLSGISKKTVRDNLNKVKLDYPEFDKKEWGNYYQHLNALMQAKEDYTPNESFNARLEWARSKHERNGMLEKYVDIGSSFGGVNAFYKPLGESTSNPYYKGHHVNITCGMASHKIQGQNPDALISVLAHELGHALDPIFSKENRASYSAESFKRTKDLRDCLIKNNEGQYLKAREDFADHFEAYFVAEWLKESKGEVGSALTRPRLLHFQYSNICSKNNVNFSSLHSDDFYRFAHVYSHPEIRKDMSEFNLPEVPFCPQLLPESSFGTSAGISR